MLEKRIERGVEGETIKYKAGGWSSVEADFTYLHGHTRVLQTEISKVPSAASSDEMMFAALGGLFPR